MSKPKKPVIAFVYDFDGTLSPGNMQEYDFFPKLGITPSEFWKHAKHRAKEHDVDEILAYMTLMLDKASASEDVRVTRKAFQEYGRQVDLFTGVESWFGRINSFAETMGLNPQHFIVSSGIREMIEGTLIRRQFERIFASAFIYDKHGVAVAPGLAVNYTTKTQFLFRINKGVLDVWDNTRINDYVAKNDRVVPFERMIYFGDGLTDVPCMKLVKAQGGFSIAVYKPGGHDAKKRALRLVAEDRTHCAVQADYSEGSNLDQVVGAIVESVAAMCRLRRLLVSPSSRRRSETVPVTPPTGATVSEGAAQYVVSTDQPSPASTPPPS